MSKSNLSINIGGGSGSLLLVLILLKAFNVVNWSWWWVLSPLWAPFALLLAFGLFLLVCLAVACIAAFIWEKLS